MTVTDPTVLWPLILGLSFLIAGLISYRADLLAAKPRGIFALSVLGPVFIAASIAAFAGEHFTIAKAMTGLVPKWMPSPLVIVYFVGIAHICAALSLVAKRCVKWAALGLALMFTLFVFTLFLPSAFRNPTVRMAYIFPAREGTFAMAGVALFAITVKDRLPKLARSLAVLTGVWVSVVLIFFGGENIVYPGFIPGVPDNLPPWSWIPAPHVLAYAVGIILIACGAISLAKKVSSRAIASAGLLMLALVLVLFVPEFFIAKTPPQHLEGLNFIFDTLLFAGSLFVIANAQSDTRLQG